MIKYVTGDLFDHVKNNPKNDYIIPHVCNNEGGWGAGFVIPLAKYFPKAQKNYKRLKYLDLGKCQFVENNVNYPNVVVANMIAQTLGNEPVRLKYYALSNAMQKVAKYSLEYNTFDIICPKFGSALAGGDWNIIETLINEIWIDVGIDVTVFELPIKKGMPGPYGGGLIKKRNALMEAIEL